MTAADSDPGPLRRGWRAFSRWRHGRPFWGGLLVTLGGLEILASERAPLPIIIHIGVQGLAGYLTPLILVLCGLLLLFHPVQRTFYSLLAVVLSLGSWITSNLGGFFVGMLLGLIGGALAFAWGPRASPQPAAGPGGAPPGRDRGAGEPEANSGAEPPARRRSAGLDLVTGGRRARPDSPPDGDQGPAGRRLARSAPGRRSSARHAQAAGRLLAAPPAAPALLPGNPGLLAVPLAPIALSVLAVAASRGLLAGGVPMAPPIATPSVSPIPGPTTVPSPRPSPDPSSSSGHARPPKAARAPAGSVAADQFSLTSRFAALTGLSYDGIASVPTAQGPRKMLKFTMRSLRLPGAVLTVTQTGGSFVTSGSSMEFTGHVELYTTKLTGELDGIRVTFTSAKPPSGLPANLTLTQVVAEQPFATANLLQATQTQVSAG